MRNSENDRVFFFERSKYINLYLIFVKFYKNMYPLVNFDETELNVIERWKMEEGMVQKF